MGKHVRSTIIWSHPFSSRFHKCVPIAIIWALILGSLLAVYYPTALVIIGVATAIVGAVAGAGYRIHKVPQIGRTMTRGIVALALIVEFMISAWWIGSIAYAKLHDIDLRSKVHLDKNINAYPKVSVVTLDVPIPVERDGIELTFQVTDHNPALGNCAPFIEILLAPTTNGGSAMPLRARPDVPVWIDLQPQTKELQMKLTIESSKDDANCGVDIAVIRAMLRN